MNIGAVRQYLNMFMQAVSENTTGAEIVETEDGPVLYCSVKSPFETERDIGYQISMLPYDDSIFAVEIIMFLFTDIGKDKYQDMNRLINTLNNYIVFGSFRLFEEGSVLFCQGMMLDETMQTAKVNEHIVKTLSVMENTAVNAGEYILRLLNGENINAIMDDIGKEG